MKKFIMVMIVMFLMLFCTSLASATMVQIKDDTVLLTGTVYLHDGINFKTITADMAECGVSNITLLIDSPGGYAIAMWDTIEWMEYMQKWYDIKFTTVNIKLAASAAAMIWLAGDELQAVPRSQWMFHCAYMARMGMLIPYEDLSPSFKSYIDGVNLRMAHWILDKTGRIETMMAFCKGGYGGENWFAIWQLRDLGLNVKLLS